MDPIYVTGHRNPDTDSIVSAMAYARLRNALGDSEYVAARLGRINDGMQLYDYAVSSAGRRQCMAFSEVVAYDEASQTATLRLESMAEDDGDPGRRMRVQVAGLLTGAASTEWQGTGYTVADLAAMNPVPALRSVVVKVDLEAGVMLLDSARMAEVAVYDDED